MQNLYLKIVQTMESNKARFTDAGLRPISTIDLYNGQVESPNNFEFTLPALFIDYSIGWERGSSTQKRGVVTVDVHVLTDKKTNTESWSNGMMTSVNDILYYEIIMELMESVSTENITSLCCTKERPAQTEFFDYHILSFDAVVCRYKAEYTSLVPSRPQSEINMVGDVNGL